MRESTRTVASGTCWCEPTASSGELFAIDPLQHLEWDSILGAHPHSSFFHRSAWARVLHESYGHLPVYFCRIENGRLKELLATAEVSSPWAGRRGVSLPFTDFCEPLKGLGDGGGSLYEVAMAHGCARGWRYLECRSNDSRWSGASPSLAFHGHVIELQGSEEQLFKRFEGAVRRGIRKAEKAGLELEFGDSLQSMRIFYRLHCVTRRRHGVPPQPLRFFENIARYVLQAGHGFVAIVRRKGRAVAAAVFFHHAKRAIYKYGASDYRFQQFRPNHLLMWGAIKRYVASGCTSLHLGRTSLANEGLRRFKLSFGAREERIEYLKYDFRRGAFVADVDRADGLMNYVFRRFPLPLLRFAGRAYIRIVWDSRRSALRERDSIQRPS